MTRKTRRLIFYIFLVLFVVLAFIIILYAQGYNFNWQKKSLVVTGAFYFKSHPKEADIYINEEHEGKTNKFIKRLAPKEYFVKISKTGYHDWQKVLEIESKLVTKAENILLTKTQPLINKIADYNVKDLFFSNDSKEAAFLTTPSPALHLITFTDNTDRQIYPASSTEKGEGFVSSIPNLGDLSRILWSPDNKELLLSFSNNRYYVLDFRNQPKIKIIDLNNLIKVLSEYKIYNVEDLLFHPQNPNKIYFYSGGSLYFVELNNSSPYKSLLSPPLISGILTYTIHNNEILYIECFDGEYSPTKKFCESYRTNFEVSTFKKNFSIPTFELGQITIINDKILIINNSLYLFEFQTQVLKKIVENVEEISFSENERKLLWRTKNEIGVIWLEGELQQPPRYQYEIEIVVKGLEQINRAAWCSKTNEHIIFVVGDEIKITELDSRDKRNTVDVYSIKKPVIFFNKWNNKIYALSEKQFFEIDMTL